MTVKNLLRELSTYPDHWKIVVACIENGQEVNHVTGTNKAWTVFRDGEKLVRNIQITDVADEEPCDEVVQLYLDGRIC